LDTFNSNIDLKNFWNLISTSTTPRNQRFVSSIQAKSYPFYGVQFHPEKNPFEWKVFADRSLEGIEVAQILVNRFMEIARKNTNKFASAEEFTKISIYNFRTEPTTMSYTEIYAFKETPRTLLRM
jgi:gamma-glutamyl hydrolase